MHNMTILHKATSGVNPRGACVQSVFDCMHFCLFDQGGLLVDFILPYTLITNILYKVKKMQKGKILHYYNNIELHENIKAKIR